MVNIVPFRLHLKDSLKAFLEMCSIIKVHDFLRGPSGGIKVDNSATVRKLRASDNIYHAHAKLEGDLIVVSNQESMWLINWKLDKCIKVAVVSDVFWCRFSNRW